MKKPLIILFILWAAISCLCSFLSAQIHGNLRSKKIFVANDTVRLDSLSIIPGSLRITDSLDNPIENIMYIIDYPSSLFILKSHISNLISHNLIFSYRVFPYNLSKAFSHKTLIITDSSKHKINKNLFYIPAHKKDDIFKTEGLNKSGSIARGISFGNSQDISVNSALNLQMSGNLGDDINIEAAITDNNIPVQPQGNTQQLREFDKVFIRLWRRQTALIAGDFEIKPPGSYFMNYYKKAQGAAFSTNFFTSSDSSAGYGRRGKFTVNADGAISKGKYARNSLPGIEGIQGPYRLHGNDNETYITVLAGTEKVFIDGRLLMRGQDYDYVIDYNTAEVTFTPKNPISKDKRIIVEFQYSDKNYARTLFHLGTGYEKSRLKLGFNFYNEQDLKSQSLQQKLSPEQKKILANAGDSLLWAVTKKADRVPFSSDEVLYRLSDTIVDGKHFDTIYIYSTDPGTAHYRLGFSEVGMGKGYYLQVKSSGNGRVFKWVAPLNNIPQGNFEPVMQLIAPRKKQMFAIDAAYKISKSSKASAEIALSNNDINTFSSKDNEDNTGFALKLEIGNKTNLSKDSAENIKQETINKEQETTSWILLSGFSWEYTNRNFSYIERYRSAEFERDWNLTQGIIRKEQSLPFINLALSIPSAGTISYSGGALLIPEYYKGFRNSLNGNLNKNNFFIKFNGSWLNAETTGSSSEFIRHNATISKKFKPIIIGINESSEHNTFSENAAAILLPRSFSFSHLGAFISNSDTSVNKFRLYYSKRIDNLPRNNSLTKASTADNFGIYISLMKNRNSLLNVSSSYRILEINNSALSMLADENTLTARIEYISKFLKGSLCSNTFYETGSGLELKKEYSYIKVADGQGVYKWTDYNADGVSQLNEFDIAVYRDDGDYIKIWTPTNAYFKAYTCQFSEVLNINPEIIWSNRKGIRKFLSRFSDMAAFSINRKSSFSNLNFAYNPFISNVSDSALLALSYSFRNSLYFNRFSPLFSMELNYQDSRNKALLTNGFETAVRKNRGFRFRWNLTKEYMLGINYENATKSNSAELFGDRNFDILINGLETSIAWQPANTFRISLSYKYSIKNNTAGEKKEQAINNNTAIEIKYSQLAKASLSARLGFISLSYNAKENTPLAFEMLESLSKGNNAVWTISYQRDIGNNMQLNISYDGRKPAESGMIHTGTMQLRAYF